MTRTPSLSRRNRTQQIPVAEITTFPNAVRYLSGATNFERMRLVSYDADTFKLDRMRTLLEALGNPQEQVRMVHVAGTSGKGSTVAMIASMLQGCQYAVGKYTSPHMVDIRERIMINNEMISRTDFVEMTHQVAEIASKQDLTPTYFELMTAIAFCYFAEQAVDIAVIETGLGGRLDCTNVITPEVSIITQISKDHTQLLGDSLEQIAAEKAGIFKRGVPAITCRQEPEVEAKLREIAAEVDAPLRVIDEEIEFSYRFVASSDRGPHTRVCLITDTSEFMHLPVPLPGEHQAFNCGLALAAIDVLKGCGFSFEELPLHEGLAATVTPGRMELIWNQPRIMVDGAHNAASIRAVMRSVGAHIPYDSLVCVFGCCEDKDVDALLEQIALGGDKVIFTKAKGNPRAADPQELQQRFGQISGKMCQVAEKLPEALDLAAKAVGRDDLICVTGSFYLVGETKKHLAELEKKQSAH